MYTRNRKSKDRTGLTLIELIVAITVTGLLIPLVFTVYINVSKSFRRLTDEANTVEQMISTKSRLDQLFGNVGEVISVTNQEIMFTTVFDDTLRKITFSQKCLKSGNSIVCKDLQTFSWSKSKISEVASSILMWDARIGRNGWIGGVVVVKEK